ncbi:hypothetical protein C8R43DRAFT_121024 [Mycena crocata]|nr:hypothetical protein C8R43DRAFT_121024 [Mycena crocata]
MLDHHDSVSREHDLAFNPYSQHRTTALSGSRSASPPPSGNGYDFKSASSDHHIDLSGLIPMYDEPGSPQRDSGGKLLERSYDESWRPSEYPTIKHESPMWYHSSELLLSPQQWNTSLRRDHDSHTYSLPSPYSSTPSSSSSPSYFPSPLSNSLLLSGPPPSQPDGEAPKKSCFHCLATTTPLWRREPSTQRLLCNACGLYLQQRNKLRPKALIEADIDDDETAHIPDEEYTGRKCSHCLTRRTSVWRRSKTGAQVCNACGVYARLRGRERPLSLRRNKIRPRMKHTT